eukprot:6205967-Pleurochrysis_carterae.AAC.1
MPISCRCRNAVPLAKSNVDRHAGQRAGSSDEWHASKSFVKMFRIPFEFDLSQPLTHKGACASKDRFIRFIRMDFSGAVRMHLPVLVRLEPDRTTS